MFYIFNRMTLLELMVLKALSSRTRSIGELLACFKEAGLKVKTGSLYPLLSKLHAQGFVDKGREESETGGVMKTYELAYAGVERLRALRHEWHRLNLLVTHF